MNVRKVLLLFLAIGLIGPSVGQADQAVGTPKSLGDFRPYSQAQQSMARYGQRARPGYRYRDSQRASEVAESRILRNEPAPLVAEAPVAKDAAAKASAAEARRFSQAPATKKETAATSSEKPCPQTSEAAEAATPSSSDRRYSYAPAPASSSNFNRSYYGNSERSSMPTWSLMKTDPRKYNIR